MSGDGLLDKEQLFKPGRSEKSAREEETWGEYICAYVVVDFLSQVIFLFLLFLRMVMYANKVERKEKEKLPEIKTKKSIANTL